MIRSTRGLKVALGLCLMALGLVGASPAHAVMHWNVAGAPWAVTKPVEAQLNETAPGVFETGILHTKIGGNAVLFECKKGELIGVSLETEGKVKGGDVKFSECITKINGITNPACEPNEAGTNPGVILTNPGDGLIILHTTAVGEKWDITEITSLVEELVAGVKQPVFARIKMSAECPIGSNVPVIGKLTIIDVTNGVTNGNEVLKELLTHLIEQGPLTELWVLSKTAEHVATILGKAKVFLVSDQLWSGNPE
jgi:hypothetical protein